MHHRWASSWFGAGLLALSVAGGAHAQGPAGEKGKSSEKAQSDKSTGKSKGKGKRKSSSSGKGKGTGADKGKDRPEVKVSENASRRFSQGVRYLTSQDPGRYEKAYREFKAAYADSPSWKILGNLGIVAQELERDGEAIDAFEAYLDQAGKDLSAEERKQFKEDLEVLRAGYSTVTIETVPDGAWIVDERLPETGEPIVNRYGPTSGKLELRVRAGHHRMVAELSGYEGVAWEFSDPPGGATAHRFELHPPRQVEREVPVEPPVEAKPSDVGVDSSPGSPALRVTGYVALGLGAVGAGLGTYFLIDAYDKRDKADAVFADCEAQAPGCAPGASLRTEAQNAEESEGSAFQRSMLTFAAGGALAATGVVLLLVSSGSDEDPEREASIVPWVGPRGVGVSGRF